VTELRALPARLDVVRPPGDDFVITVSVNDGTDPIDISGWTLTGEGADATITDGAGGVFTVEPEAATLGARPWRVTRTAPGVRSLIAGDDRVSDDADLTAGDLEVDLQIVDGGAVTLTITGGSGAAGASTLGELTDVDTTGGTTGQVLTQQADGTFALETSPTGVTDHGLLDGLADDDHTQYALADGSRGDFEPTGTADAAVTVHEAAADPHSGAYVSAAYATALALALGG